MDYDQLSGRIIGAAIEVHKALGPGLLESAYEQCLCRELSLQGIPYERQVALPVEYKGASLDCGYRLDLVVNEKIIVELKAVSTITDLHRAQLLTYLRLYDCWLGLIINFNTTVLRDGITRLVDGDPR